MKTRITTTITCGIAATVALLAACGSPAAPSTLPTTGTPGTTTAAPATTAPPTAGSFPFQPLWPFATAAEAKQWQDTADQGHSPWHADAVATAQSFTQNYLGFADLDQVTTRDIGATEAWVGVGAALPNGSTSTAAVVHLARFGEGADAPWEVVGTKDDTLTLDTPAYGSTAASPVTAGGVITGVDESLHLQARRQGVDGVLGESCCVPAGGEKQRWSASVTYTDAGNGPLTLVVSTGGHVADVERFAVTAIVTG